MSKHQSSYDMEISKQFDKINEWQRNFTIERSKCVEQLGLWRAHFEKLPTLIKSKMKVRLFGKILGQDKTKKEEQLRELCKYSFKLFNQTMVDIIKYIQKVVLSYIDVDFTEKLFKDVNLEIVTFSDSTKNMLNSLIEIIKNLEKDLNTYKMVMDYKKTDYILFRLNQFEKTLNSIIFQIKRQREQLQMDYKLKNNRKNREKKLQQIITQYDEFRLADLAGFLGFEEVIELEHWILSYPYDLFIIDDDTIIFNKEQDDNQISESINELLKRCQNHERLGIGKKI